MLKNAYLLAKIGADTAENEQRFAEILPIGRRVTSRDRLSKRAWRSRGGDQRPRPRGTVPGWVENKESSPNTDTGYQPNIKSFPNIDIPRIIIYGYQIFPEYQENCMKITA